MAKHLAVLVPVIAVIAVMYPGEPLAHSSEEWNSVQEIQPVNGAKPTPQLQSPEEAQAQDFALTASARGWTVEQARADHRAAEAVGRVAEQVAAKRPDLFVGSVLSSEPGGAPALYIKGLADDFVRGLIGQAELEVRIVGEQPYSFEELKERSIEVHRSLQAQGFTNLSTGFDITKRGEIQAAVTRQPGSTDAAGEILSRLAPSLRDSVALTVADGPVVVQQSVMGGTQMRYNGVDRCTSGWSVYNEPWGITGITTAGHCDVNQIVEPGVGVWSLALTGQHQGLWGDVEWHQSSTIEAASFYANSTTVRNVTGLEGATNIIPG
jgi:streptogrisin C